MHVNAKHDAPRHPDHPQRGAHMNAPTSDTRAAETMKHDREARTVPVDTRDANRVAPHLSRRCTGRADRGHTSTHDKSSKGIQKKPANAETARATQTPIQQALTRDHFAKKHAAIHYEQDFINPLGPIHSHD